MQPSAKLVYHFGLFRLDTSERILLYNQQHLPITPKAFEILLALVEGGGQIPQKRRFDAEGLARRFYRGDQSGQEHL